MSESIKKLAESAKKDLFEDELVTEFMRSGDPDGFFDEISSENGKEK